MNRRGFFALLMLLFVGKVSPAEDLQGGWLIPEEFQEGLEEVLSGPIAYGKAVTVTSRVLHPQWSVEDEMRYVLRQRGVL